MMHENIELKADMKGKTLKTSTKAESNMKVPKGKKNNLQLLTFWPSHWNTCEEYGIHTHP